MEGGIIFGLTAALKSGITFAQGRVQQRNFHDYQMLRIDEAPEIEVYIVPSTEPPTGVGEPGVPRLRPPSRMRFLRQQASGSGNCQYD